MRSLFYLQVDTPMYLECYSETWAAQGLFVIIANSNMLVSTKIFSIDGETFVLLLRLRSKPATGIGYEDVCC